MFRTIGIVAHVDAGKTTFTENLLSHVSERFTSGRVDHGNTFLDFHEVEKSRGMTVFAEQARFTYDDITYTWIDTPGHLDFSPEMERTLPILDAAVVVISALDGLTGTTEAIIAKLQQLRIPIFYFINKMDATERTKEELLQSLQSRLHLPLIDVTDGLQLNESTIETLALSEEQLLDEWIEDTISIERLHTTIRHYCKKGDWAIVSTGSALHDEGVFDYFKLIHMWISSHQETSEETSGVIFKIRHDARGRRLAFARILSGVVRLRETITFRGEPVKVTNLFVANGNEYTNVQRATAGDIVVFLGLPSPEVGDTFGQTSLQITSPQAMMKAEVHVEDERPLPTIWPYFEQLGAEDPSLNISWDETRKIITIHMLGLIQLETLQMTLRERFQLEVTFSEPKIIYRETINKTIRGYGHFEPLKHYAEVHVELSPNEEGIGITYADDTHPNDLTSGERMLIQEEVLRGTHYGTSIGAEWTDIHVRLLKAATHLRHTSPGDLQQATRRAIRQALEKVNMTILEPMYELNARIEAEDLGRLMSDIERGAGIAEAPIQEETRIHLRARVPVANFASYPAKFASLTKGRGQLTLTPDGYTICHNSEAIIERSNYEITDDTRTTSASIFCEKGAGYSVPGTEAEKMMHLLKEK